MSLLQTPIILLIPLLSLTPTTTNSHNLNLPYHLKTVPSFECVACQVTVFGARYFWGRNNTELLLAELVSKVCRVARIETALVCQMMSSAYRDEVLFVLGQAILEPRQICGLLLRDCGDPYDPLFTNWTLPLPDGKPPVEKLELPKPGSPTLRVLHLSDIHYDPEYLTGAEVNCPEPLCCRPAPRLNNAEPPVNRTVKNPAGYWGSFGSCDVPWRTVEAMFEHIRTAEKFDYILWTGDLAPHDVWNYTQTRHIQMLRNLTLMLHKYFPNVPVYSAVGNHEGVPADSFPPNGVPDRFSHDWLYDTLAKQWRTWLPSDTVPMIKFRASYVTKVRPGLRLISINTQYCYETNFWLYINATDPDDTLTWLIAQLHAAERDNDKVHIIGHVPPGDAGCLAEWSRNYYDIVNRFESTIRAQFFGHTHHDSFSVFYENGDPYGRATNMYYVAPSVTTFPRLLPAYRVYVIDGLHNHTTWSVLDHETYFTHVQNLKKEAKPKWKLEYKAKEAYNMTSLFPEDWNQVIHRFTSHHERFREYLTRYTRTNTTSCGVACQRGILCELKSAKSHDETTLCKEHD